MKISIGCDHGGFQLKQKLIEILKKMGLDYLDRGCFSEQSCDYPDFAKAVCEDIQKDLASYGILICRSGVGMAIAANKMTGIRAAVISSDEISKRAKTHNNINVMCLAADFSNEQQTESYVKIFLSTTFEGDRHIRRLDKIHQLENIQTT